MCVCVCEPLDETVLGSGPPKIFQKRGNTHTLFQFVLTPLANRLVTPVGAMRSFKLNVWMMTLSKRSFSECWGVMCQLLGQQQEPGSVTLHSCTQSRWPWVLSVRTTWASGWDGLTIESPENISKISTLFQFSNLISFFKVSFQENHLLAKEMTLATK